MTTTEKKAAPAPADWVPSIMAAAVSESYEDYLANVEKLQAIYDARQARIRDEWNELLRSQGVNFSAERPHWYSTGGPVTQPWEMHAEDDEIWVYAARGNWNVYTFHEGVVYGYLRTEYRG